MGSNTSFEVDLSGREKIIYNYELKRKRLNIYLYKNMHLVSEKDKSILKFSNKIVTINKKVYIEVLSDELNCLKNDLSIEIKYIKL